MINTLAGFIAGVLVALAGAAGAAGDQADDELRTTCHSWSKPHVYQCNVYLPAFTMARLKLYREGEYQLGVDYFPGWEPNSRTVVTEAGR
jgi:hypothetical protein